MLKQGGKGPETRNEFVESLSFQGFKILVNGLAGIAEPVPVCVHGHANGTGSQIENVGEEFIGMLRRDAILLQGCFRKILEIVRDNDIGPSSYGGGQHVSIIWIGQLKRRDEVFEVFDQAVADVPIHQFPGALQIVGG